MSKRVALITAAFVAAVVACGLLSLPPRQLVLDGPGRRAVRGAIHIHTNRSDGRSSPAVIAEAAARAGLTYIILTDHGDGTRLPDPPAYRAGVLCIDGVEVSTADGHYLAIGLSRPTSYPLGGEARAVVEDVGRLGGFGLAAHPDSPKHELQWRAWEAPFDGLEVINLDTSWRLHVMRGSWLPRFKLLQALMTYPIRPVETIADLARTTPDVLSRWSSISRARRVVAVAGSDAHAKLALVGVDPGQNRLTLPFPGYEPVFRAVSVSVIPNRPMTGDAAADALALLGGLRAGHAFIAVDGIASPALLDFSATNAAGTAQSGDELADDGPLTIQVRTNAPPSFTTSVWRDNVVLGAGYRQREISLNAPAGPAVYRVEIRATDRAGAPLWVMSNPIYVRPTRSSSDHASESAVEQSRSLFSGLDTGLWRVEQGASRSAPQGEVLIAPSKELEFRFKPPALPKGNEPVALLALVPGSVVPSDRVTFSIRSDQPRRVSLQLRTHVPGQPEERWQRSVYVDAQLRDHTIRFDDLTPVGQSRNGSLPLSDVVYVLFVVDNVTAEGRIWISNVALQR